MSFINPIPCPSGGGGGGAPAPFSSVTTVPASTSTVTLKAANASRNGVAVFNDSTSDIYIKLGAGASTTSFTVKGGVSFYYETPFNYTGIITAVWSSATGNARVTEVTV